MKSAESKQKEKEAKVEPEQIMCELGAEGAGKVFRVVRNFYLQTKVGPLEEVKKGCLCQLLPELAETLFFANRIEPLELGLEFEAVRNFSVVETGGEWLFVRPGDILKMSRGEALGQMRKQNVRERKVE